MIGVEMFDNMPPQLTGGRMEKFLEIIKNAPRDPSCGCVKIGETARLLIEAIFSEQRSHDANQQKIDIEMEMKDGETKTQGEP